MPPFQVWLQNVKRLSISEDIFWTKPGQMDIVIPVFIYYTTSLHDVGVGKTKRQKQNKQKLKNNEACKSVGQQIFL